MAADAHAEVQHVAEHRTTARGEARAKCDVGRRAILPASTAPVRGVVRDAAVHPVAVGPRRAAVGGEGIRRDPAVGARRGAAGGGALLQAPQCRRLHLIEYAGVPQRRAATCRGHRGERTSNEQAMSPGTERRIAAQDGTPLLLRVLPAAAARGWIIVLHGLDDHLDRYGALSQFLQESGYDVVLYDQRGHGRSGGARCHVGRFSDYVDDLERVREAGQAGRATAPHLFAHSMGSVIALLAAMRQPQRWRSVIVQGVPVLPGRTIPKGLEWLVRLLRPLVSRLRVGTGLEADALSRDAAVVEAYRRDPLVNGSVTLGWGAEFLGALRELRKGAPRITCPLLILHGESDTVARPDGARWLEQHAGSKDRRLAAFRGLKHELHNEVAQDRARVFAEIRAWLERH